MQTHTLIPFLCGRYYGDLDFKRKIVSMNIKKVLKRVLGKRDKGIDVGRANELERKKWLEKTLKNLPYGSKILDAGAGQQQYKKFCTHLDYVSQDFGEYNPEELDSGLQREEWNYGQLDIVSDIASIPCEDASFDVVMCTEVLEHVINPREAINEFSRLLRQDGLLILTAPFCSLTHFAPYHFYSGFNTFFYKTELTANGFEILEMNPNGNYFEYLAQEINRLPKMSKQYCNINLIPSEIQTLNKINEILKTLSKKDTNSSELLCYGYHLLARKK